MQIGGGLGEEYMHAPALNVGGGGGSGGGGFLANLLDLLGIHKQVAKGPKDEKGGKKDNIDSAAGGKQVDPRGGAPAFTPGAPTGPASAPPQPVHQLLDSADAAFSTIRPRVGKMDGGGLSLLPNVLK